MLSSASRSIAATRTARAAAALPRFFFSSSSSSSSPSFSAEFGPSYASVSARTAADRAAMTTRGAALRGAGWAGKMSTRGFSSEGKAPGEPSSEEMQQFFKEMVEEDVPGPSIQVSEEVTGDYVEHQFQAETRQLLDIVAKSLYTEREVFVRELLSNGSDALEKLRHLAQSGAEGVDLEARPLEISVSVDEEAHQLIIQDTGIGLTESELRENLGTIARSGSKQFVEALKNAPKEASTDHNIIGMFGVGFYSCLMVADSVRVYTKSAKAAGEGGGQGYLWETDGSTYKIAEADGVERGTKIVLQLNEESVAFASKFAIDKIVRKYSNFLGFPIRVNGELVNSIQPLWTLSKADITEEMHEEFYKFIANAHDKPYSYLHFLTDAPIDIRTLIYFPQTHMEKFGMGRLDPGVDIYSKKVLIQSRAQGLLPEWLRFAKGVVDSEDIPLNISREHLQDSALIRRIGNVVTKRIIKHLLDLAKKEPEGYLKFYNEFDMFLKEGVVTDFDNKDDIAKLLRFESSATAAGETTSLDEYMARMKDGQSDIHYISIPNRQLAESSPYMEAFNDNQQEVLFLYTPIDDFVMVHLSKYQDKPLSSIEKGGNTDDAAAAKDSSAEGKDGEEKKAAATDVSQLGGWLQNVALPGRIESVNATNRLKSTPMIVTDHESASVRRMMMQVDKAKLPELAPQKVEVNPSHPIIKNLEAIKDSNPDLAKEVAEQLFDNALVAAGLLDDSRTMLKRLNGLMDQLLAKEVGKQ